MEAIDPVARFRVLFVYLGEDEAMRQLATEIRAEGVRDGIERAILFITSPVVKIADVRGYNTKEGLVAALRALLETWKKKTYK